MGVHCAMKCLVRPSAREASEREENLKELLKKIINVRKQGSLRQRDTICRASELTKGERRRLYNRGRKQIADGGAGP